MPKLALVLLLLLPAEALPQQPAATPAPSAGSSWTHVQVLPMGTSLDLRTRTTHSTCVLKAVTADSLTCARRKDDLVVDRAEVKSIRIRHRGRSTLVGTAIGAGAGAIVGAASGSSCTQQEKQSFLGCFLIFSRADLAGIFGLAGGVVGAGVGAGTDFTRSTVYKAP